MRHISYSRVQLRGGFWGRYADMVRRTTVHAVYERMAETGRFDALRCDWKEGDPNPPHIFWDSDVAKWIEAVAYLTKVKREPELEAIVDETAANIARNQKENGYFNSYYLSVENGREFQDRTCHELYCAGHLIEAAIAYEEATGKDLLLQCMIRYADHIYQVFFVEKSAAFATPGHEELELALVLLYRRTGDKKYLTLAKYFIEARGANDVDFRNKAEQDADSDLMMQVDLNKRFAQDEMPIRRMTEAFGHAVRAGYLYCGLTDVAAETGDEALMSVAKTLFDNIYNTKMSITGAVGSCMQGEAFGFSYDLPNVTNYNETCAAIAFAMFADRLQAQEPDSRYGNVIERILYNGMLSGIGLDGRSFFYENALELDPIKFEHPYCNPHEMSPGHAHFTGHLTDRRIHRAEAFTCFCCPPNICRFLAGIAGYFYSQDGERVYCHQFADSIAELTVNGVPVTLEQKTDFPNGDTVTFTCRGGDLRLYVRIPDWCRGDFGQTEKGYLPVSLTDGKPFTLTLPMEITFLEADPRVHDCAGRCAVQYGPFVYCMESEDNGFDLRNVELLAEGKKTAEYFKAFNAPVITADAQRRLPAASLYAPRSEKRERFTARLIPYFAFANRQDGEMLVWTQVK